MVAPSPVHSSTQRGRWVLVALAEITTGCVFSFPWQLATSRDGAIVPSDATDADGSNAPCGDAAASCCGDSWRVGDACVPMRSCASADRTTCSVVHIGAAPRFDLGDPTNPFSRPLQPVTSLSDFWIDASEVTVERFRAFWRSRAPLVASVRYPNGTDLPLPDTTPFLVAPGVTATEPYCNYSDTTTARDLHPMNCITWETALAFCVWDGGRLPTEAEWEWVARTRMGAGLSAPPRTFPWGSRAMPSECSLAQHGRDIGGSVTPCVGSDGALTRRVNSFSDTGGVFDLAGNVSEWTADAFSEFRGGADGGTTCWEGAAQTDPLCTAARSSWGSNDIVLRGGGVLSTPEQLDTAFRNFSNPSPPLARDSMRPVLRNPWTIGIRCVRSR